MQGGGGEAHDASVIFTKYIAYILLIPNFPAIISVLIARSDIVLCKNVGLTNRLAQIIKEFSIYLSFCMLTVDCLPEYPVNNVSKDAPNVCSA